VKQKIFSIPGTEISIYTYGTLIVVAFLLAAWWLRRRASRGLGLDPERVFNAGFALLFLGIAGARLGHVFAHYSEYTGEPMKFLRVWEGGLNGYGGLVGALLWLWWWLPRRPELKGFEFFDLLVRAFLLAFAIGWLAPLLAGDDFGAPTSLPWGIPVSVFEDGTPAAAWAKLNTQPDARLHPTQVYEALLALGLFLLLARLARKNPHPGRLAALGLMLHAAGHALLELTRGDEARGMVAGGLLSFGQFLAIPVFFAGLALWLIRKPESHGARPRT
jgi:prolipoprotein diacylglyceryl transferase